MKTNKKNYMQKAQESLSEILKRIEPYMPKTPEAKPPEPVEWRIANRERFEPTVSKK